MKTKIWLITIITVLIFGLSSVIYFQVRMINNLKEDLSISISNEKALLLDKDSLDNNNRVLQLTIDQLNYVNDSIIVKMNEVRKELQIKDKYLRQMEYLLSEASKPDTVVFRDTLFVKDFKLDTLKQDKWYSLSLRLEYPSTIIVEPKFISEKYVIQSYRKETIKPPKKCWLGRAFQKKHTVLETEIIEKSPYIITKKRNI